MSCNIQRAETMSPLQYLLFSSFLLLNNLHFISAQKHSDQSQRKSIVQEPKCVEIRAMCPNLSDQSDDVLIIECLQSLDPKLLGRLSDDCQHVIWTHMNNLLQDENIRDMLMPVCRSNLDKINCQVAATSGSYLKCIVNNKEQIDNADCVNYVLRIENVAFYDYRWIAQFVNHCNADIDKLNCGRLDHDGLTQSETISCLQNHYDEVNDECKKEIFKLTEIQSDSIKLDRQLYLACAEDQMRYCRQFAPGSGRVYSCLIHHRFDSLQVQCQQQLLKRQKLISQDYRISKGLMKACRDDIKKSHCRKQTSDDKSIRMAQVLLCLESVMKNGTRLEANCVAEMSDQRRILMEDFRLSPEIVDKCSNEIQTYCMELEAGGRTIHCLMDHARLKNSKKRINYQCQRALEDLVKETDLGEDWRVDPVLHEACQPVVRAACQDIRGGNARVLSCLLDNIAADHMTEDCEEALYQIQYFVARDFKLDPQLYNACRDDAAKYCNVRGAWDDKVYNDPENGPQVLPCLYRYAYNEDKDKQLKEQCFEQIRRVMRQRALSVDLMPEVEDACLPDLASFCFDKTEKGEEMLCLQNNLDKLDDNCKHQVEEFTEKEAQNVELNAYVSTHCKKIIQTLCTPDDKHDQGSVMECLISNKNNPTVKANPKCRISIEHFQLISLKNYKFSFKFKAACKNYAMRFCVAAKTKSEVVACLSEKITNDTIAGIKSDVQKECRQQLKAQLFQQRENIHFDPKLERACHDDIRKFCKDVEAGSSQVLECLQSTSEKKLSDTCQVELFKVKKQETSDNSVDYALQTLCEDTIQLFCPKVEKARVLDCLKRHKDDIGFNKKCLAVVKHRIIEQNTDYRLNPLLQENCKMDIKKFCYSVAVQAKPEKELNGEVIDCLKKAFKHAQLSNRCEKEMSMILRDQAMDVQLNPLLRAVCRDELDTICKDDLEKGFLEAEECLKNAFLQKRIPTAACRNEVVSMLEESQADINVDPTLQQTCALDLLKYCKDIQEGNGRHIRCLKIVLEDNPKSLTPECKSMLSKRFEMYKNVAQFAPPEGLQQLYNQVTYSPAKHYFFFVTMMVIGTMFAMGMFCGRVTRRHMLVKNK